MRPLLVLLAGVLAACGGEAALETADPAAVEPSAPVTEIPSSGWEQVPRSPIQARDGAVIGWTGSEIVVVGGTTHVCPPGADCSAPAEPAVRSDAAAFDPDTKTWRTLADAPIPVPPHSPHAAVDGDLFVLVTSWSGPGPSVLLRHRTEEGTWETVEVPAKRPLGGLLAAGDRIVVHLGSDESGEVPDLSFDPTTGVWDELPPDPLSPSFDRHLAWDGKDLFLFAKELTPSPGGESGPAVTEAARLRADGAWERLPTGEDALGFWAIIVDRGRLVAPELGCADGGAVNGYGRCIPFGGAFDPASGTWQALPEGPSDPDARSAGAFTAEQVLLTGQDGHVLDLTADTWVELPGIGEDPPDAMVQRTVAGVGPHGFAFGGVRWDQGSEGTLLDEAWIWTPAGQ